MERKTSLSETNLAHRLSIISLNSIKSTTSEPESEPEKQPEQQTTLYQSTPELPTRSSTSVINITPITHQTQNVMTVAKTNSNFTSSPFIGSMTTFNTSTNSPDSSILASPSSPLVRQYSRDSFPSSTTTRFLFDRPMDVVDGIADLDREYTFDGDGYCYIGSGCNSVTGLNSDLNPGSNVPAGQSLGDSLTEEERQIISSEEDTEPIDALRLGLRGENSQCQKNFSDNQMESTRSQSNSPRTKPSKRGTSSPYIDCPYNILGEPILGLYDRPDPDDDDDILTDEPEPRSLAMSRMKVLLWYMRNGRSMCKTPETK